jgi:PAS domain S-box-containing protein
MKNLERFFSAPEFPNQPDKTLKARQVNVICNWGIISLLAFALLTALDHTRNLLVGEAWLLLSIVILLGIRQLSYIGRVKLACWLLPILAGIALNISVINTGGVAAAGFGANMIIIILAGMLINLSAALGYTIVISLFGLGLVAAQSAGLLPAQVPITSASVWVFQTFCFLLMVGILRVAVEGLRKALADIRHELEERNKSEKALRDSEERFSSLSSATSEGIGISDQDTIVDANPQLASMLGYKPGELIGLNANDFVAPESRNLVNAKEEANFEGLYEHLAVRKDGSTFPVEIRARTIPYKGRLARVAIIHDISDRKQFEKSLSQQIERLRGLHTIEQAINSSMDLHTILDLLVQQIVEQLQVDATSVLLLNTQKQTLDFAAGQGFHTPALKYTSLKIGTGLAGRAAKERRIVHIDNLARLENNPILARSIMNEKFVAYFGVPLIAKDQVRGVLEIFHRSTLAPDPNWLRFLETLAGQAAISIDNARLLEMTMESLKESNALYRINQDMASTMDPGQIMQNVVNLLQANFGYYYVQIFVIQPETGDFVFRAGSGKIGEQFKNQGYRLAAGEGIVGYTAETQKPFFTNDVDNVISFVRAPFLTDSKSELAVPIKAGERFLGLLDIHQSPPAILTEMDVQLVSAIADQLAVALQKAQLYADLQNSLLQEQATRTQLVHTEKLATAGRLLASVSHELNNPLQAIQNALFLLKDEKGISAQGQQDLKIVLSEAERMATLLERLRTTYQPIGADDFQPVQINSIIEDVHALVATHLRHASISFTFHSDPQLPAIPGLADQLKQVLLNLFMNAVDAMPGGGTLIASTACLPESRDVLITITDTGTGIDKTILPNLFEAFITNKDKGTGLGLAISYEIIQKHRGRIWAENQPEGGAKFSIWLPLENGAAQ